MSNFVFLARIFGSDSDRDYDGACSSPLGDTIENSSYQTNHKTFMYRTPSILIMCRVIHLTEHLRFESNPYSLSRYCPHRLFLSQWLPQLIWQTVPPAFLEHLFTFPYMKDSSTKMIMQESLINHDGTWSIIWGSDRRFCIDYCTDIALGLH